MSSSKHLLELQIRKENIDAKAGINIKQKTDRTVEVTKVLHDSPFRGSGLAVGHEIIEINGHTDLTSLKEALEYLNESAFVTIKAVPEGMPKFFCTPY